MAGPYDAFVGVLNPGDYGWITLDVNGTPVSNATLRPPDPGPDVFACSVRCNPTVPLPEGDHLLLTFTGAPLTEFMVPNTDNRQGPPEPEALAKAQTKPSAMSDYPLPVQKTPRK